MPSVFPPGARLAARYRVARVVAHGPVAALYEAEDLRTGELVAFKWLYAPDDSDAALTALSERARRVKGFSHPEIVRVRDVEREDDSLFVVSSWQSGEPYSHVLAQQLMRLDVRLSALTQAMRAVAAGHEAGIAHCGLHPDNLFLASRGASDVKVLDFALNQTCAAAMFAAPALVGAGHHVFMAPEQLAPGYTPNARTDVFACAVLVYQALSGQLPFSAPDAQALIRQFAFAPPPVGMMRHDVPARLSHLLAACLSCAPEQRPASLDGLIAALEDFAQVLVLRDSGRPLAETPPVGVTQRLMRGQLVATPPQARAPEQPSQPISHHGEHRVGPRWPLIGVAIVLGGAALAALGFMLWPSRPPRVPVLPPALPALERTPEVVPPESGVELPKSEPVRAKKVKHSARRHVDAGGYRAGRPLSRDDF
jgi:serine/threonine-protein kinase